MSLREANAIYKLFLKHIMSHFVFKSELKVFH